LRTGIPSQVFAAFKSPARQNALGSLLIQGSIRLSRFVLVIAAAALLTPASFASAAVAMALTDLVRGALQAFDVDAVRVLAGRKDGLGVVQASLDAKGLVGVAGLSLVAATAAFVYDPATVGLVSVSGAGVLAASFATSFLVQQQAALDLRSMSSRVAAASAAGAVVGVLLAWLTRSAGGVVVGAAIGDGLLLAFVCGRHRWKRPDWQAAVSHARESRRLLFMQFAYISHFRIGTIVLAAVGSDVAVGEYAIASRVAEGLIIVAAALTASSLPMIGAAHARNERVGPNSIFERSYSVGIRLITPTVAIIVLAAPLWIAILFPQYPAVGASTAIAGFAVIAYFASSQTTALLNATHHDRPASWSAIAGLGASLVGSIFLFPLGAVGVSWARVAGEFVRLCVEATAAVRYLRVRPSQLIRPWIAVLPTLGALAIAVAGNWESPYIWVAVLLVIGGTAHLLAAVLGSSRIPT
jgi:O-antigen/teichoic acid export membrane protein